MEKEGNVNDTCYVWNLVSLILYFYITLRNLRAGYQKGYSTLVQYYSKQNCRFTASHMNQGGALIQVYRDGSVILSHGGTEMGQGLFTKTIQVNGLTVFQNKILKVIVRYLATYIVISYDLLHLI